jgi:hypothetical protein
MYDNWPLVLKIVCETFLGTQVKPENHSWLEGGRRSSTLLYVCLFVVYLTTPVQ